MSESLRRPRLSTSRGKRSRNCDAMELSIPITEDCKISEIRAEGMFSCAASAE